MNRRPEALAAATAEPSLRKTSPFAGPFAAGYERWFDPLYAYVSRHVASRRTRERIVRQVLAENLDLLVGRREEAVETRRLQATADRLIADIVVDANQFLERRREERFLDPISADDLHAVRLRRSSGVSTSRSTPASGTGT